MSDSLEVDAFIEEYRTLRQEGFIIIQSRYQILTANVAIVGALIGVGLSGAQPDLNRYLPVVFMSVLFPSLLMNYYLTVHFSRLSSYIYARYEETRHEFTLYKAISEFRKSSTPYLAYTVPILITYGFLVLASQAVALFVNRGDIIQWSSSALIVWSQVVITLGVLLGFIWKTWKTRRADTVYLQHWLAALSKVKADSIGDVRASSTVSNANAEKVSDTTSPSR